MTLFSVWPSPERSWDELRSLAEFVDDGSWHCLWYADHFMPNTEDGSVADGDVHEIWSMLSATAAVTERIRIGSLVSPTTVRHPALLANTAATLDRISSGRLTLGIGAGWQVNEHRAYGIPLLDNKDRVDRFEEALTIVRQLLTEDRTTFAGRHFTITDAPCRPRPVQSRLPIMVGTGGPRMSRITVTSADEWNTWGTPEVAATKAAVVDRACESHDRDPDSLHRSVQALFFPTVDDSAAAAVLAVAPPDRSIAGSVQSIVDAIGAFVDTGFDEIIVPDFTLGAHAEARRESYEKFRSEVLPHFS
jgi:alkanesulfonate monooxygenase SsuD/methylene tetrahydromethanopterin reductase-like flavin-dependent oxidoreductase (luciferase family)